MQTNTLNQDIIMNAGQNNELKKQDSWNRLTNNGQKSGNKRVRKQWRTRLPSAGT